MKKFISRKIILKEAGVLLIAAIFVSTLLVTIPTTIADTSQQLLSQSFDSCYPWPPTGWTSTYYNNWQGWYSNYAGGIYPELVFTRDPWNPQQTDTFRFKSPLINTVDYGAVQIQFKHAIDHNEGPYILKVESSQNGESWNTVWEMVNPGSQGAQTETILTDENVGSDNFYVSWTYVGNSYNINYWFIDDIFINGSVLLDATISINPETLNAKSQVPEFTCYIELPTGYNVNNIDKNSIRLNRVVGYDSNRPWGVDDAYPTGGNGIPDLMVKFDRDQVEALLLEGVNTITITGKLIDGTIFKGTDTIEYNIK